MESNELPNGLEAVRERFAEIAHAIPESIELTEEELAGVAGGEVYPQLANEIRNGAVYALSNNYSLDEVLACLDDLEGRFSPEDVEAMRDIIRSVYTG